MIFRLCFFIILFLFPNSLSYSQSNEIVPALRMQYRHMLGVIYTAISPDGNIVATGGWDGSIALWHSKTGRLLWRTPTRMRETRESANDSEPISTGDLSFSRDGNHLVQSLSNKVVFWDIRKGKKVHEIKLQNKSDEELNAFSMSEISQDGTMLLTYYGGTAELWNISTWKSMQKFPNVARAAISPNNDYIVVVEDKKTKTNKMRSLGGAIGLGDVLEKANQVERVSNLAKKRFFTVSAYDIATKKKIKEADLDFQATRIRFSPSGKKIAVTGVDLLGSTFASLMKKSLRFKTAMRILDTETLTTIFDMPRSEKNTLGGFSGAVLTFMNFPGDFSKNEEDFIMAYKKQLTVWNLKSHESYALPEQKRALSSISMCPTTDEILISDSAGASLIDIKKQKMTSRFEGSVADNYSPKFSRDGKKVFIKSNSFRFDTEDASSAPWASGIWSLESGARISSYDRPSEYIADQNDQHVLSLNLAENKAYIYDPVTTNVINSIELPTVKNEFPNLFLSPKSSFLVMLTQKNLRFFDLKTSKLLKEEKFDGYIESLFFTNDENMYLISGMKNEKKFCELRSMSKKGNIADKWMKKQQVQYMAISENGKYCALLLPKRIDIYSIETQKKTLQIPLSKEPSENSMVNFSQNGERLFYADSENPLTIYSVESGKLERTLETRGVFGIFPSTASDSADGATLAVSGFDGFTRFIDTATGEERCALSVQENGEWFAMSPSGQFDASNLDDILQIHWVVSDRPLETVSYDTLLRQYYEPGLLKRVVLGETIAPPPSIVALNRTRPKVSLPTVTRMPTGEYKITVLVENVRQSGKDSGAVDLRLFRDGQLVAYQDGVLPLKADGTLTKTFTVAVEERSGQVDVEFSAFVFNTERVKSETVRKVVRVPAVSSPRKPRAYVIAIGINQYNDAKLRLQFAVNDSQAVLQQLIPRLKASQAYSAIVPVALEDKLATRANFKAVLDKLSGKSLAPAIAKLPLFKDIVTARPGDLIFLSFSGHGSLGGRGEFYLISQEGGHVTADDLALWLRDVDATNMTLVIDACHSAASIEADKEFKPGPMGSKSLGQLAYDKGIRILAATQSDNVALESKEVAHGLLTYALISEGVETGLADYSPTDGQLSIAEWLRFSVERVPILYESLRNGKFKPARGVLLGSALTTQLSVRKDLQQPMLFDFTRGRFNAKMPVRKFP
jgi:WD40 repeat protein